MEKRSMHILSTNKKNGLGIVLYCNRCKRNLTKGVCEETGKSLKLCPFAEKHIYKVYVNVPGAVNQRKTKNLKAKDYYEALKEALKFRDEVKRNVQPVPENLPKSEIKKEVSNKTPQLLKHALARYIGWLNNEGVPAHRIKERSPEHIKNVALALKNLVKCLKEKGYNLETLRVDGIDDEMIGHIYSYLENRHFANRTYNKYFSYYTSFLKWYADEYNSQIRNWFERAPRKQLNPNPQTINQKDFEELLKIVTRENGIREYNGVFNFWDNYLLTRRILHPKINFSNLQYNSTFRIKRESWGIKN